jgi:NADPH:quinone reductase-like Zn-dependent oxidoreductase
VPPPIAIRRRPIHRDRRPSHEFATPLPAVDIAPAYFARAKKESVVTQRLKVLSIIGIALAVLVSSLTIALTHNSPCADSPPLAANIPLMKASVYRCYGSPRVVKIESLEKPQPAPDRVLVKVAAASVNPLDWHYLKGEPYLMRAMAGIGKPNDIRLGVDFAGTVEAVGVNVKRFRPGDRVFGGADGSLAEYVTVREQGSIVSLPPNLSFEQAAAIPIAGVTALQALRDRGQVRAGQSVLINGASGGVGTYAVQIAKLLGAKVTGVCSTRNVELVRGLGADKVIDYTREDFTQLTDRYDLIVDNVGSHSQAEYRKVLTPTGAVVAVGGVNCGACLGPLVGWLYESAVSAFISQKRLTFFAQLNAGDLGVLADWMAQGKIRSVVDRTYQLQDVPAALAYLEEGHARGKVIITLPEASGEKPALARSESEMPSRP